MKSTLFESTIKKLGMPAISKLKYQAQVGRLEIEEERIYKTEKKKLLEQKEFLKKHLNSWNAAECIYRTING